MTTNEQSSMSGAPKNGLCSVTFRGLAVNDIVTMARDSGLDCIEWGGDVHAKPSLGIEALRAIGAATRAAGMTVSSYGTYHRLGASDPAELPEILACAKALGAPVVRVWAGDRGSSESSPEWRAAVHAAARNAAAAAAREGLRISLECHINTLTDDPEEALSLLSEGPEESFGMHWQPNQFHDEEWNLEYAGAVSARVNAVHVFNWSLSADGKVVRHPLSDGIPAWRRYLALLPAAAPRLLEFVPGDDPAVLRREAAALEALRRP